MSANNKGSAGNPIIITLNEDVENDLERALDYRGDDVEDIILKGLKGYIKEAFWEISEEYSSENENTVSGRISVSDSDLGVLKGTTAGNAIKSVSAFPGNCIEDKLKNAIDAENSGVNTYPFGDPTNEIYSQWLGVYHNRTDKQGLENLLEHAKYYMSRQNTDNTTTKDIIILTDIWERWIEDRIISTFRKPYIDGIIRSVTIFLYDDNKITRIPFDMPSHNRVDAIGRDISRYSIDGQNFQPKNKTVLAVVRNYVSNHPVVTLADLQNRFPRDLQGTYETCENKLNIPSNLKRNFFFAPDEIITLDDGTDIVVCNQWGLPAFERFREAARKLDYKIERE